MGGKKAAGENSKKAAGNARKAEAAAGKKAAEDAKRSAEEDKQWSKGSKSNAKKDDAEAKKADAARKKAERDALLAAEEASQPSKPKGAGAKSAGKKNTGGPSRGLDLSQLDDSPASKKSSALNATGIDNALDALSLTGKDSGKIDRHPERRFKAAYAAYEARRLPEIEQENPGLRRQQRIELVRKEFEKSEENPFNQVHVAFDASREEIAGVRDAERKKVEARLTK
ncbi:coiled-coil domain-containing protein [Aspergillus ellipticus CBS 707.79]|uniref:Coiled-coil domain-containing protein n=1 Tax=Aspergillus ellipticus CBS 707.79 TaxID=1448320 RepID=A0A319DH82_9EURO|nr:coiled-coil domain-containing protein [Aspergillus ellipticus CBS 707.79]